MLFNLDRLRASILGAIGALDFAHAVGVSTTTQYTTILSHALEDDTVEAHRVTIYGEQITGGTNTAVIEVVVTAKNVAGVTTILGTVETYAHKTLAAVTAQVIDDGGAGLLVQVRDTVNDWQWRVETAFKRLRF